MTSQFDSDLTRQLNLVTRLPDPFLNLFTGPVFKTLISPDNGIEIRKSDLILSMIPKTKFYHRNR